MSQSARNVFVCVFVAVALSFVLPLTAQKGTAPGQWPSYAAGNDSTGYSAADLINRDNVKNLQVAWSWKFDNFGNTGTEVTALMVNGVLYFPLSPRRTIVAADAGSGETLWIWRPPQDERETRAARTYARGVAYWKDGEEERIITITPGFRLVALDLKTGVPVSSFGTNGFVDLFEALDLDFTGDLIGRIGNSSPPVVSNGVIMVGPALTPSTPSYKNVKGDVLGFDARTGRKLWAFHTIPRKGEFGYDTWLDGSADYTGNTGVWGPFSADDELGYAYLNIEAPTNDFYGGHRPGDNLFSNSLVCIDIKTGKRVWHRQLVHHDIWDYDMPPAPILLNITVEGRPIKSVVQMGKQSLTYVFDRTNGQPVWPMPETPVKQTDVPGEWTSQTQPIPSRPPAFDLNGLKESDLIDFTPALRQEAIAALKASNLRYGEIFMPGSLANAPDGTRGTVLMLGGANWWGGRADPETGFVYVSSAPAPYVNALRPNTTTATAANASLPPPTYTSGGGATFPTVQGLRLLKPPYGRITAYNMNKGEIAWQIANGDTPANVRNHQALQGLNIPKTGSPRQVGLLVTKTLLFAGDGTNPMLNAYDKQTGEMIAQIPMPGMQTGVPMTYVHQGRQFILVAVGANAANGSTAQMVAYALPDGAGGGGGGRGGRGAAPARGAGPARGAAPARGRGQPGQ
ncbi:MAG TPA: pyrroloquinoline quinone-dependent dehydrogenase [Terriglobia bacterium]|nr:pyrroloquinoline quinone-dependent dehydrogenase [Terriglobia bacterium]